MAASSRLSLAGENAADMAVISAHLQDAVTRKDLIVWNATARRWRMLCGRLCRADGESSAEARPAEARRVLCDVRFEHVRRVRARRTPVIPMVPLELLAMRFVSVQASARSGVVRVYFAGGMEMDIDVAPLDIYLTDLNEAWSGPRPERMDEG